MATPNTPSASEISAEERAADSKADAISAVLLVAIAVATAVYWIAGH